MMGKCTVVIVAHRLNTLNRVDAIYEITEEGTVRQVSYEKAAGTDPSARPA